MILRILPLCYLTRIFVCYVCKLLVLYINKKNILYYNMYNINISYVVLEIDMKYFFYIIYVGIMFINSIFYMYKNSDYIKN